MQQQKQTIISDNRIPALDGIRGIAILLVMLHHFTIHGMGKPTAFVDNGFYLVTAAGWCGVDLFLVLSGFLITGILLDSKGGNHFFRNFYMRRMLRIFPLYYGFLVVFFFLLPHGMTVSEDFQLLLREQGWYWSYLVNLPVAFEGWSRTYTIGHFWSLAVEEQFYVFWPVIVFFSSRRQLAVICLMCFTGSFGVRLGFALAGYPLAAYVLTPARMDTLAVGAYLALVVRRPNGLMTLAQWIWPIVGLSVAGLGALFVWQRGLRSVDIIVQTIGYSMIAVMFGGLVTAALISSSSSGFGKSLVHPALTFFGRYSYGIYVFHHPIVLFLKQSLLGENGLPSFLGSKLPALALFGVAAMGISVPLAWLSWHFYEAQFLKLKVFFPYQPKTKIDEREQYDVANSSRSVPNP